MFCSLGAPFKIIAPAGAGGSCVVSRDNRGKQSSDPKVATTKLSTMELLLKSSVNEHFLPDESRTIYSSGPQDIMSGLVSKRFDAACIWEPYATILARKHGLSKTVSYNEIGEHVCCALSAGNHLNDRILRKIALKFKESIAEFVKNPDSFLPQYSLITGFDSKIVREVSGRVHLSSGTGSKTNFKTIRTRRNPNAESFNRQRYDKTSRLTVPNRTHSIRCSRVEGPSQLRVLRANL